MNSPLRVAIGSHSSPGRKMRNQDCLGHHLPGEPLLSTKGIAIALADGISTSEVSHIASESAIRSFFEDYYSTSEAWSVQTSAERVIGASNAWLYAQTRQGPSRYDTERGYVCTLSALILKARSAYLFHVGDSRIYRLRGGSLEQLTHDHRVVVSEGESYLSRALGSEAQVEVDHRTLTTETGDCFVLATDGVHEYISAADLIAAIATTDDLDAAAKAIVDRAYANGSDDNLSVQVLRIEALPPPGAPELDPRWAELPPAPILEARQEFEGYRILRELHGSSRSHIYLAEDGDSGRLVALKTPSIDLRDDPAYLERFMLEEWIARRVNSAHVLKPYPHTRPRSHLYVAMEYIEGQTLAQWMIDNPRPELETVRDIVEQIARGLLAFHRMEMLHQDLRPNNIMIDAQGTVRIIDFGSTRVAGLAEAEAADTPPPILGTVQYTAPEYFLGEPGTPRSDLFSLGVIAYQMLCGRLPYGAQVAKARTRAAQKKLRYASVLDEQREIPAWMDAALEKAVQPDPNRRYAELSEFVHDLRHPNAALLGQRPPALIARNPLLFWQALSFVLAIALIAVLSLRTHGL